MPSGRFVLMADFIGYFISLPKSGEQVRVEGIDFVPLANSGEQNSGSGRPKTGLWLIFLIPRNWGKLRFS